MKLHSGLVLPVIGMAAVISVREHVQGSAAQTVSGSDTNRQLAFEVASIKPNKSGPGSLQRAGLPPGERVTMINVPLLTLIQIAYPGMSEFIGGPKWMGSRGTPHFDADRLT